MNQLFVPLAQAYLECAVKGDQTKVISHTDPEIVESSVLQTLQDKIESEFGKAYANVHQEMGLTYDAQKFEKVVHEVFNGLIFDFCGRIVKHKVDVVLLAGQPSKLTYIQELVRRYLPLQSTRVVPMFNHYAGGWYPYQEERVREPGIIVDPKSAVAVGAAVEYLMVNGYLGEYTFTMNHRGIEEVAGEPNSNEYYWGLMNDGTSRIEDERLLFEPGSKETRATFPVVARHVSIGRRLSDSEYSEASPVWRLRLDTGNRTGSIRAEITIEKTPATHEQEETLNIVGVEGTIAGEEAVLGENVQFKWRTLADERYYLDTGALDNIHFD